MNMHDPHFLQIIPMDAPIMLDRIKASLPSLAPAEQRVGKLVLSDDGPSPHAGAVHFSVRRRTLSGTWIV